MEEILVKRFKSKDGKIYLNKDKCIRHEKIIDGILIKCPECGGLGSHDDGKCGGIKCNNCNGDKYVKSN